MVPCLVFAAAVIYLCTGCGQYPEGPDFSLRSKKARVANTWYVDYATDTAGNEITSDFDGQTWEATKDGDLFITIKYQGFTFKTEGNWEFRNDNADIFIQVENPQSGDTETRLFKILKLEKDAMWWDDKESPGGEFHFKPVDS
jgi:hypothetical protein